MLSKIGVVNPISLPVTLERAKDRLHIDSSDFDQDLDEMLRAAIAAVERHTGRALWFSTWEWRADCWPGCYPIEIPMAPVRDVTQTVYLDVDGIEQVADGADWNWRGTAAGAEIWFVNGYSFPTLYDRRGSDRVTVRFTAGYDDDLDPGLDQMVKFLVGHWFDNRASASAEQMFEVPDTFKYLANQLRIFR